MVGATGVIDWSCPGFVDTLGATIHAGGYDVSTGNWSGVIDKPSGHPIRMGLGTACRRYPIERAACSGGVHSAFVIGADIGREELPEDTP